MKLILNILLLQLASSLKSSSDTNSEESDSFINTYTRSYDPNAIWPRSVKERVDAKKRADSLDEVIAKQKADIVKKAKISERKLKYGKGLPKSMRIDGEGEKTYYHKDPVLNVLRKFEGRRRDDSSGSSEDSSSLELPDWKNEWSEIWQQKKIEAAQSNVSGGDVVNMVAARPWGVQCRDPTQENAVWGSCMLAMECDAEFRIYRGDQYCGKTQFVCCAIKLTDYDLYQGFDVSFSDSQLETDSEEKKNRDMSSRERKKRKKAHQKKRRKKKVEKRKRELKKKIDKTVREIRKILNKAYRNGTLQRKKKTKELKKFLKDLKKQFKEDKLAVQDIHDLELTKIDDTLKKKLNEIMEMNINFMKNSTFRDIILHGLITKKGARMLVEAYPELDTYLRTKTRRVGDDEKPRDYLDYDIEYGLLYY